MNERLPKKFKSAHNRKKLVAIIFIAMCITFSSWWAYANFMPHPLGDRLEYIGKVDYGCLIGLCDSHFGSTYYYATDMDIKETIAYFKKSSIAKTPDITEHEAYFGIKAPSGEVIYASLYTKDLIQQKYPQLRKSSKKYVLEIPDFKYEAAKASL